MSGEAMERDDPYSSEVVLALASVALFEGTSGKDINNKDNRRWNSLSPQQSFRLLHSVLRYEQIVFELYTCSCRGDQADTRQRQRRSQLQAEAKSVRRVIVDCLKDHPDVAGLARITDEDQAALVIPFRTDAIAEALTRLRRFVLFLRRCPTTPALSNVCSARTKILQRMRAVCETRLFKRETDFDNKSVTEMTVEHDGVTAKLHPPLQPIAPLKCAPVSSSLPARFSRYYTLHAIALGLAALSRSLFGLPNGLQCWEVEDLDEIVTSGADLFSDTVILLRQLAAGSSQDSPTEAQLDRMLHELDEQMELTPFDCRAISSSRDVSFWRALRCGESYTLSESTIEELVTKFFLSSKMALFVAKNAVVALFDGTIRGALEVTDRTGRPTFYPNLCFSEMVDLIRRVSPDKGALHLVAECSKTDLIPRPIDHQELEEWSESQRCMYQEAIRCLLEDQERQAQEVLDDPCTQAEQQIWRRLVLEEKFAHDERDTVGDDSPPPPGDDEVAGVKSGIAHELGIDGDDDEEDNDSKSWSSFKTSEGDHSSTMDWDDKVGSIAVPVPVDELTSASANKRVAASEDAKCHQYDGLFSDEENRVPSVDVGGLVDKTHQAESEKTFDGDVLPKRVGCQYSQNSHSDDLTTVSTDKVAISSCADQLVGDSDPPEKPENTCVD